MVKHTQTVRRQQPRNCLSVFDHFVGLVLKRLKNETKIPKLNYSSIEAICVDKY